MMEAQLEKDLIRGIKRAEQYLQENKGCDGMKLSFHDDECIYDMEIRRIIFIDNKPWHYVV